jgi:hypothetical protein
LYQDHVTGTTAGDADDAPYDDDKRPLKDVTSTIRNGNRNQDFGSHWDMTDASPAATKNEQVKKPAIADRKADWNPYESVADTRGGINIAGNGMGSRKTGEAAFSLFDDEPPVKKENASKGSVHSHRTEGDGMGGVKGADSFWDF